MEVAVDAPPPLFTAVAVLLLCGVVGVSRAETGGSRLSMTNRADHEKRSLNESVPVSRFNRLTERGEVTLREEVEDFTKTKRPVSWHSATNLFEEYIERKAGTEMVFDNKQGDTVTGSDPHRFAEDYGKKQYAKLKDLERGVQREYGKSLHTAMLTLTASATPDGEHLPPVDHLDELLASWDAVRRELDRVLEDRRYSRLAILEPHPSDGDNNGYLHIHVAVFMQGYVPPEAFERVYDAHVRNCDFAKKQAHTTGDIDVRHTGLDRGEMAQMNHSQAEGYSYSSESIGNLACYLAEYLGTYDDPLDQPEHVKAANAVLWATGRQRWRPGSTAQEFMKYDGPDDPLKSEWEFVGIKDSEGEIHPVRDDDDESDGCSYLFETAPPPD